MKIPDKLYLIIQDKKSERYGDLFEQIEAEANFSHGQCDSIEIIEEWLAEETAPRLLPDGFNIYVCSNCKEVNVKRNNQEITIGYCDECEHPLWNG